MKDVLGSASRSWRAALLVLTACTGLRSPAADESAPRASDSTWGTPIPWSSAPDVDPFFVAAPNADTARPVGVRLALADAGSRPPASHPAPSARPLDPGEAEALLLRLAGAPAVVEPPAFRFPARSMPAPRPGTSTRSDFLGSDALAAAAAPQPRLAAPGPLRAVHTAPRGEIASASQVAVVFSRPMVPLAELGGAPRGVELSPAVPGGWRWLDPYTLVFEAAERLPKATRYTVEVPAGVTAVDGEPLAEAVQWTFSTAAPTVLDVVTSELPAQSPVLALIFDQRVEASAVLPFLRLGVEGRSLPLRLATANERGTPDVAVRLARWRMRARSGSRLDTARIVVVRPDGRVPAARGDEAELEAVLRVLPGVPSLEGPLRTAAAAEHPLRVPAAFSVVEHGCGRAFACWPGVPWTIRFSGRLGPRPDQAPGRTLTRHCRARRSRCGTIT